MFTLTVETFVGFTSAIITINHRYGHTTAYAEFDRFAQIALMVDMDFYSVTLYNERGEVCRTIRFEDRKVARS